MTKNLTKVECSRCGDVYETTKRNATVPFLCSECAQAPEFWGKIEPATSPVNTPDSGTETGRFHPEGCDCDSASVDATTELITELENDNATAQKQIGYLEAREKALTDQVSYHAGQSEDLGRRNFEAGQLIVGLIKELFDSCVNEDTLAAKVSELTEKLQQADAEIDVLRGTVRQLNGRVATVMESAKIAWNSSDRNKLGKLEYWNEIKRLKAASLWTRIFHWDYSGWC